MFGNKHDEQHLLKGVSIYLQNLFGNRVGVFTIQCKRMHTRSKNISINMGLHVFGERCALRHVYKFFIHYVKARFGHGLLIVTIKCTKMNINQGCNIG
jgi:hypothetical protein